MGQRLIFDIKAIDKQEEVVLASVYYHWSGFTFSTLATVKEFIEQYRIEEDDLPAEFEKTRLQKLILTLDILYRHRAKLSEEDEKKHLAEVEEAQKTQKLYIPENYLESIYELNRNHGIISLEEDHSYGENFIFLNVDEQTVEYPDIYTIDTTEDEKKLMEWVDENLWSIDEIPVKAIKIHDTFKDFEINSFLFESYDDFLELVEFYQDVYSQSDANMIILGPHSLLVPSE